MCSRSCCCLQRKGVNGYILDLRDNPGGLVKGSIDIARLLLDGHPTLFSVVGRDGEPMQEVRHCQPFYLCCVTCSMHTITHCSAYHDFDFVVESSGTCAGIQKFMGSSTHLWCMLLKSGYKHLASLH